MATLYKNVDDLRIAYFPNAIPTVIFADLIRKQQAIPIPIEWDYREQQAILRWIDTAAEAD
jgi:hypothetical protein